MLLIAMLILYIGSNMYIFKRGLTWLYGFKWLAAHHALILIISAIYIMLAALVILGGFHIFGSFQAPIQRTGNLWLGFCFFLFLLTAALDIFILVSKKFAPGIHHVLELGTWNSCIAGFAIVGLSLVLTCYGWLHAQNLKTTAYELNIDKQAGSISSLKMAFLADTHIGAQIGEVTMKSMVQRVNDINADVVIIGGDIFDSDYDAISHSERVAEILKGIKSTYGVYAVYGNHDVTENLIGGFAVSPKTEAFRDPRMDEFLEKAHINVLEDEVVTIADGSIYLVGRLDGEKAGDGTSDRMSPEELMEGLDMSKPVIVAEHEPVDLNDLSDLGADLILSGHIHDGQFFPITISKPFISENSYGLWQKNNTFSIVTSGVGFYGPPMRILTDGEVVEITINFL